MTIREMMLTTTHVFCVHTIKDLPKTTARITGMLEEIEREEALAPLLDMLIPADPVL